MAHYRLGDHQDHYNILHEDGRIIKMAKGGLTPALMKDLDGLPCFAMGGYVPGDEPCQNEACASFGRSHPNCKCYGGSVGYADGGGVPEPSISELEAGTGYVPPGGGIPGAMQRNYESLQMPQQSAYAPAAPIASGPDQNFTPTPPPVPMQGPMSQTPPGWAPPPPAPRPTSTPGTSEIAQYNKAMAQRDQAIQDAAKVDEAGHLSIMNLQDTMGRRLNELHADQQKMLGDRQAKADAMFEQIYNGKIDPDLIWKDDKEGGGGRSKITAAISVLFGGLGQGFQGAAGINAPNVALGIINQQIDRSIAAQRDNLENKRSLLNFYQKQTGDILQAQQLTKATMLDAAAAQISAASSQMAAGKAQPLAQEASAKLRMDATAIRQQLALGGLQIESQKLQLAYQKTLSEAVTNLINTNGSGTVDRSVLNLPGMESWRERHVPDIDPNTGRDTGRSFFANGAADAEKLRTAQTAATGIYQDVAAMSGILNDLNNPMTGGAARAQAVQLRASMAQKLHMLGYSPDQIEAAIPSDSFFSADSRNLARLQGLKNAATQQLEAIRQQGIVRSPGLGR